MSPIYGIPTKDRPTVVDVSQNMAFSPTVVLMESDNDLPDSPHQKVRNVISDLVLS